MCTFQYNVYLSIQCVPFNKTSTFQYNWYLSQYLRARGGLQLVRYEVQQR